MANYSGLLAVRQDIWLDCWPACLQSNGTDAPQAGKREIPRSGTGRLACQLACNATRIVKVNRPGTLLDGLTASLQAALPDSWLASVHRPLRAIYAWGASATENNRFIRVNACRRTARKGGEGQYADLIGVAPVSKVTRILNPPRMSYRS
jgi:hypothetical protein